MIDELIKNSKNWSRQISLEDISAWAEAKRIPADVFDSGTISSKATILVATGSVSDDCREAVVLKLCKPDTEIEVDGQGLRMALHELKFLENLEVSDHRLFQKMSKVIDVRKKYTSRKIYKIKRNFVKDFTNSNIFSVIKPKKKTLVVTPKRQQEIAEALAFTPTPNLPNGDMFNIFLGAFKSGASKKMPKKFNMDLNFVSRSETLMFIAAKVFDRIILSPVWDSEYLLDQTQQLNMYRELTELAHDISRLDRVLTNLPGLSVKDSSLSERLPDLEKVFEGIKKRLTLLCSLAFNLSEVEGTVMTALEKRKAEMLHGEIDELLARNTAREYTSSIAEKTNLAIASNGELFQQYQSKIQGDVDSIRKLGR